MSKPEAEAPKIGPQKTGISRVFGSAPLAWNWHNYSAAGPRSTDDHLFPGMRAAAEGRDEWKWKWMMKPTSGFTLLEMLVALVVARVLGAIAVSGFGGVQGRLAVRSARAAFLSSHAHARALAVERGQIVSLVANAATGQVSVQAGCDGMGAILESLDLVENFAVELEVSGDALSLCMTPKGVASPALNSFDDEADVAFVRGTASAEIVLLPLGQAIVP